MNIDSIRKIIDNAKIENRFLFVSAMKNRLKHDFRSIMRSAKHFDHTTATGKWLLENLDFLKMIFQSITFRRAHIRIGIPKLIAKVLGEDTFSGKKDEFLNLFQAIHKVSPFSEKELECFHDLVLSSLLHKISCALDENPNDLPHLITLAHQISRIDFFQIAHVFSPVEKILRQDPTGEYTNMTRQTQASYRDILGKMARRKRKSMEAICRETLQKAKEEGKHIGFYLAEERKSFLYFPSSLLIFFAFLFLFCFAARSWLLTVLSAIPLYLFSRSLADFFISKVYKSKSLPAMRCEVISAEEKTCVAIASLITNADSIHELCKKLERYRLNNRAEHDELFFGLLCDLPQSNQAVCESDQILIDELKGAVEQLNSNCNCFFAVVRDRVFHKSENAYVGWERKRGAIEQFVGILSGDAAPSTHHFFGNENVLGSKFLITLDADTELGIGQAKRLVGRMLHPLNRPRIEVRGQRKRVAKGFGILQPKISTSLLSNISTPFAKIYSNGSGEIRYATASFDSMQTLFGEGNFCGKGIIDVSAYRQVLTNAFPEQAILSHDMLEGSLLRCAIITDEFFVDSDPQSALSHYKRLHRWIRGDVQNIPFLQLLPPIRRIFAIENVLRYSLPAWELALLFCSYFFEKKVSVLCAIMILIFHFRPLLETVWASLSSGNFQLFGRRFQTKMRNQVLNSFYQCTLSLAAIAHEAIYFSDAILRSVHRMAFSKKKLLEWQVYSPFSGGKDPIIFFLPSLVLSVFLLYFVKSSLILVIVILFLLFPFIMLLLSQKYVEVSQISQKERQCLLKMAEKEFSFFQNTVSEKTSFLPPDNIQFEPIEKIANRTSPTNIGLYLASLVAAYDLKIISLKELCRSLTRAFESIDQMEHFQGHLYNWYDLTTLGVIGERFVSTVDSGNYIASLLVVTEALKEVKSQDQSIPELLDWLQSEIENVNFNVLFNRSDNLFHVGIFPEEAERETSHYDLYMSEARITSFLAIALGKIPSTHWNCLQRPILSFSGRVGIGSWTGTCFEYFMAPIFLPVVENSLEDESLDFALHCQKRFCAHDRGGDVFGISESGYHRTDEAGNLQYMAFGTPYLSVRESDYPSKVISPYSSFLMLMKGPHLILENLMRLQRLGASGPFGFFEAVEFNSNFIDDYVIVRSYMAHHKGMSVLSLCNVLCENSIVRRFMKNHLLAAKTELLAERFPIEGKVYKKRANTKMDFTREKGAAKETVAFSSLKNKGKLFTDGKLTMVIFNNGENRFLYEKCDLFDSEKGGIRFRVITSSRVFAFDPDHAEQCKVRFASDCVEYILISEKISLIAHFTLISGKNAALFRLEVNGISEPCRVEIDFDLILQKEKEYRSHPSFQNLSLEGKGNGKRLLLRRRGITEHRYLQLESDYLFKTAFHSRREEEVFPYKMLYHTGVTLCFDFKSAESLVLPLVISCEKREEELIKSYLDGSFHLKKEIRETGLRKMRRLDNICLMDRAGYEKESQLLLMLSQKRRMILGKHQPCKKEFLWRYGVSGDVPIVSLFLTDYSRGKIKKIGQYLSAYKKLQIAGLQAFDLVILHQSSGGYFDPIRDELSALVAKNKCEFIVGKHPGIHFVACENTEAVEKWKNISLKFIDFGEESESIFLPQAELVPKLSDFNQGKKLEKEVGAFLENGFLVNKKTFDPPVPFSHVISDRSIGFVCNQNSLGFTWFRNSGLNRISKWDNLPSASDGEKLFLKRGAAYFDLLQMAQKVTYRDHIVIFEGNINGEAYSVSSTLSSHLSSKLVIVLLSEQLKENAALVYSFVPALGQNSDRNIILSRFDKLVLINPALYDEYESGAYFYGNGQEIELSSGEARLHFSIPCELENTILLGGYSGKAHLNFIKDSIMDLDPEMLLKKEKELLAPNKSAITPIEFWTRYQAIHSRFFARTGVYQSSGAYGFRDQLQDSLIFLKTDPEITKRHIIRCASHQFEKGDVLHWWHAIRKGERWDPGVRSRCSDDYLWLLFVTSKYIQATEDLSILSTKVPYLSDTDLPPGEAERYLNPKISGSGTLLEHLAKAAALFMARGLGPHRLPDIGSGDWNDGMNLVDGESVWLGFFGAICLNRCKPFFDTNLQTQINDFLRILSAGLREAFNGVWFVRAYRKNGDILGNDVSLESECSIDLITQAFSSFYELEFFGTEFALDQNAVKSALTAAFDILFDEKASISKLFVKPFVDLEPTPGYIKRYCAGVRENGGQYTHAAVWFALALLEFGTKYGDHNAVNMAKRITDAIDPSKYIDFKRFQQYQREPYVLCGDVYDAPGFRGHGGWSWYTGAAAWFVQLLEKWKETEEKEKLP